jgi:hypothetical protein
MVIPGFSKYDITKQGVVTHVDTGIEVKRYRATSSRGYYYIRVGLIDDDGNRHACNVLRLLALTYLGDPPVPSMARAKDGDNLNISLNNVEWVPYAQSTKDAWKSGRLAKRAPRKSACTETVITAVLNAVLRNGPVSAATISCEMGIPYTQVRYASYTLMQRGLIKRSKEGLELV